MTKSRRVRWAGVRNLWARGEVLRGFWWGNLKGRGERVMLKQIYNKWDGETWA